MSKRKVRIVVKKILIMVIVFLTLALVFDDESPVTPQVTEYAKPAVSGEKVNVHFIDVGQGSSILIQQGTSGILIDSGEDEYSEELCDYILSVGVQELPYVIATHPHSDHIGGLDEVVEQYTVSNFVMPYIDKNYLPDTKVYDEMMDSVNASDATLMYSAYGKTISLSDNAQIEFLGPVEQVNDMNNMSIICKLTAYNTTFMFMGDAEKKEIETVYNTGADFDSDIIFVPHHGSDTSIHEDFLYDVSAEVAVISCGEDNSYGHPHDEALAFYENSGAEIYRTDFEGDIVITCDSNGYEIEK